MQKEEILQKSRAENKGKGDEMEQYARLRASSVANWVTGVVSCIAMIVTSLLDIYEATLMIGIVCCTMYASERFVIYYYLKNRSTLYIAILNSAVAVCGIIRFVWTVLQ